MKTRKYNIQVYNGIEILHSQILEVMICEKEKDILNELLLRLCKNYLYLVVNSTNKITIVGKVGKLVPIRISLNSIIKILR